MIATNLQFIRRTAYELWNAQRERVYLRYRFGFEDDTEHPLTETARHFHLSESRARSTEKPAPDDFRLEMRWG